MSSSTPIQTSCDTADTHFRSSVESLPADPAIYCSLSYVNEQLYQENNSCNPSDKVLPTNSSENMNETKYKWSDSETTV